MTRYWSRLALLAGIGGSFLFSAFVEEQIDPYVLNILMLIGINIILAVSLNLVNGHAGQFSLGHAGFMAVGAYASCGLTLYTDLHKSLPGPVLFTAALVVGGLAAALFGL